MVVTAELISYRIKKLKMANGLNNGGIVQLENAMECGIEYGANNKSADAVLVAYVKHIENPNQFYIELELQGIFKLDGINDAVSKKKAHTMCFETLFEHANSIMPFLATNSGLQGFMLQKPEIESETVNFGSKPNDENMGKIIEFQDDDFGK